MNESLQNLSRRRWLQKTGGGLGAVGLASLLGSASSAQPHNGARAKRVIQLFMNGGPYQGDLFDPKPVLTRHAGDRPKEVELRTERKTAGIMPSPFKFTPQGQSGVPVSELLPRVGKVIDEICVLRSLHSDNPNHGPALLMMNNGTIRPTVPSMGSWTLYGLGTENGNLPGYVVLCPGRPVRFSVLWNSAFLPVQHQGTYVNHSKLDPHGMIPNLNNAHLGPEAQLRQLALMRKLNQRHLAGRGPDAALEARLASMETAFRMQFEASEALI